MGKYHCCILAQVGVKFGIKFTSCSENGNKMAEAQ